MRSTDKSNGFRNKLQPQLIATVQPLARYVDGQYGLVKTVIERYVTTLDVILLTLEFSVLRMEISLDFIVQQLFEKRNLKCNEYIVCRSHKSLANFER